MRKVTKDEFYEAIYSGRLNVHPHVATRYPYTSVWKYLDNSFKTPFGKTVDKEVGGMTVTDYYINA